MSFTPGQLLGAAIGVVVVIATAGTAAPLMWYATGASIGMSVGGIIDPPEGQTIRQEGPRIGNLDVQTSEWGTPIHRLFGTYKMAGNVIWAIPLQETKHVEESGEGKGGGGTKTETTWYSYAGSWAVGFCEGEVSGIKKIWFDSVLVYDGTDYSGGLTNSNHSIYLGSVSQKIDWYMQSKNPDTPAYRSLCYILFNSIELENYGNKIPRVSVEISKVGSSSLVVELDEQDPQYIGLWDNTTQTDLKYRYSPGINLQQYRGSYYHGTTWRNDNNSSYAEYVYGNFFTSYGNSPSLVDSLYLKDTSNFLSSQNFGSRGNHRLHYDQDGMIYGNGNSGAFDFTCLIYYSPTNSDGAIDFSKVYFANTRNLLDGNVNGWYGANSSSSNASITYYDDNFFILSPVAKILTKARGDLYNNYDRFNGPWTSALFQTNPTGFYYQTEHTRFYKIIVASDLQRDGFPSDNIVMGSYFINHDKIYLLHANTTEGKARIYTSDLDGNELSNVEVDAVYNYITTLSATIFVYDSIHIIWSNGSTMYYVNYDLDYNLISTTSGSTLAEEGYPYYLPNLYNANFQFYDGRIKSLRATAGSNPTTADSYTVYLSSFSGDQVTVGSIVEELLLRAGVDSSDFDISEGTDLVNGYVIPNPMDTRVAISTVISAYAFDLVEVNSKLILKKRDPSNVIESIPANKVIDFVEINRLQTVELSRAINILYVNKDNDYNVGTQSAIRNDSNTETTKTYQYPLALDDTEAKQIAEVYLYSEWNERIKFTFSLPSEYLNLIPTDVVELDSDNGVFKVRLTKISYATDKQVNCEASMENSTIYDSNAIGSDTGSAINKVNITGPTKMELLDIPMLDNLYNSEGIYLAAQGYLDNWNGCGIHKSTDLGSSYSSVGNVLNATLIGTAGTKLLSASTTVWDKGNTLLVSMINGNLYSESTDSVLSANNYLLVGDEIIQYSDATDNGDGIFSLENLLRGRRGTEWAVDSHAVGERVVLLSSNMMFDSTASLNVEVYYKATAFGDFVEDSNSVGIVPEIRCLKPLSPSYVRGTRDGSNNLTISWARRSRDVTGYLKTLQLYEEIEEYQIEIVNADSPTYYTSYSEEFVYTDAQQLSDNSSHISGDPVEIVVYQMSGVVQRGYGTEETV